MNIKCYFEKKCDRNVSSDLKKKIVYEQDYKCGHCAKKIPPTYHIDHKIPLEFGGTNDRFNLEALCPSCHATKSQNERILKFFVLKQKKHEFLRLVCCCSSAQKAMTLYGVCIVNVKTGETKNVSPYFLDQYLDENTVPIYFSLDDENG